VNATTLGVSRLPSAFGMTFASLPSITATTELVVPKSMPMILSPAAMIDAPLKVRAVQNWPARFICFCFVVFEKYRRSAKSRPRNRFCRS
jgi:hypothetical protein